MFKKEKEYSNIRKFHKKSQFNIGLVIFGILFVYLVVTVAAYLTKEHVTAYEVRKGSILKDNSYTGLILREESLVNAQASGYVNYYVDEGSKTAVGNNVYTLSDQEIDLEDGESHQEAGLSADETASILMYVQNFTENYSSSRFSDTYTVQAAAASILQSNTGQGKLQKLDALIASGSVPGLSLFQSPDDGVVVFSMDGMEGLTKDTVTVKDLAKKDYKRRDFENNQEVKAGDPVFKLVTGEEWTVVIQMNEETALSLMEAKRRNVKVKFLSDNETMWAGLDIQKKDEAYLAFLSFDNSMVRYAKERYVDIELILEDKTGLKIPKTAVVEKSFYTVPSEYITQSGKGGETGVMKMKKDGGTEFVEAEVYFEDSEQQISYLDKKLFQKGDMIQEPKGKESYTIGVSQKLKGVYNINKGYAVFKQINILCESDEYYIISSGSSYGLSNYDHIALDGKSVKEDAMIYQ